MGWLRTRADRKAQEQARAELARLEREQEEAFERLVEVYLERNHNVVSEELSEEMLLEMLADPETRGLVETAFPQLRGAGA